MDANQNNQNSQGSQGNNMDSNVASNIRNIELRLAQLAQLEQKVEKIYVSVEKTRKYIWWAFVITVLAVVLPIIGLFFAIPGFLETFNQIRGMGL